LGVNLNPVKAELGCLRRNPNPMRYNIKQSWGKAQVMSISEKEDIKPCSNSWKLKSTIIYSAEMCIYGDT